MKKTIYLHIGHFKTGSTALQVFLDENRKKLIRRGLDYAKVSLVHSKHSELAFSLYRAAGVETLMHGYADPTSPQEIWANFFDYAAASRSEQVLASSEEFMRLAAHPRAVAILQEIVAPVRHQFDIRIVAYLRSPNSHLRSWYNQLVKMKAAPPDFNTAVTRTIEPVHYDYAFALAPWIEIFGQKAVTLRPYQEGLRQDAGLYRDFLTTLGLSYDQAPLGGWDLAEEDVNPRLDERLLELTRAMQEAGMSEDLFPWVQQRAERLLPEIAEQAAAFDRIIARAGEGLEQLKALSNNGIALTEYAADPPVADPAWKADLARMTTVLLREQVVLRQRMGERQAELLARIEALETRLDSKT